MKYSDELLKECLEAYPDWRELHDLIQTGNEFAGRLLDDAAHTVFPPEFLLEFKTIEDVHEWATIFIRKKKLYSQYLQEYRSQNNLKHG